MRTKVFNHEIGFWSAIGAIAIAGLILLYGFAAMALQWWQR